MTTAAFGKALAAAVALLVSAWVWSEWTPRRLEAVAVRLSESSMWAFASLKVMPDYPLASIAQGMTGVAVAVVRVEERGRVASVEMLQSPDNAIGDSVRRALRKWTFAPVTVTGSSTKTEVWGKVTFYFAITNGVPQVLGGADSTPFIPLSTNR